MRPIPPRQSRRQAPGAKAPRQFERLQATALYCPKCRQATPTREHLLLVLTEGNLYDYRCAHCGTSTGSRTEKQEVETKIYTG